MRSAVQTSKFYNRCTFGLMVLVMVISNFSFGQGQCSTPFNLSTVKKNDSTFTLNWTMMLAGFQESWYESEYREDSSGIWTKAYFPYGNNTEHCWIRNAKQGKCYTWRVRALCYFNPVVPDTSSWVTIVINNGSGSCPSAPPNPTDPPAPTVPLVNPNFSFTVDPCFPGYVSFSNSSTASGTTIRSVEWNMGDNTKSTSDTPLHIYQKPGNYEVVLTVTDNSGNIYTKKATVAIPQLITRFANAGSDQEVCKADTITLQASGGESYSWSPCTGLSNCNIPNPILSPGTTMNYIVTVTDKNGCIDTDTMFVKYTNPDVTLYIPDAFTPNNDGINDQFKPLISLRGQADAEWKLFNRFGNMIFSSNSSTTGWDGNYKGVPQPAGNYSYLINIKATGACPARNMKGTVLLIR
jgi:gliding motility-associated-like protein